MVSRTPGADPAAIQAVADEYDETIERYVRYQDHLYAHGQLEGYERKMYLRRRRQTLLWKLLLDEVVESLPAFPGDGVARAEAARRRARRASTPTFVDERDRRACSRSGRWWPTRRRRACAALGGVMITRRALLRAAALGAASLAFPLRLSLRAGAAPRPRFFSRAERRALEALCDRILPPDRDPGAKALGAARYVERLLTAFDVDPPGIYAGGPFSGRAPFANRRGRGGPAFPENGFSEPLALTRLQELAWRTEIFGSEAAGLPSALAAQRSGPIEGLRDVYREGLAALDALARERGAAPFPALSQAEQDDLVAQLDGPESIEFPGRGESFLDVVIRHVLEGCFAAPEYGGNRQLAGWRMIGIEGDSQPLGFSVFSSARGAYRERPRHPMSTPNPGDLGPGGSLSARPLSDDAIALQDAIADFAGFLESHVPGACA